MLNVFVQSNHFICTEETASVEAESVEPTANTLTITETPKLPQLPERLQVEIGIKTEPKSPVESIEAPAEDVELKAETESLADEQDAASESGEAASSSALTADEQPKPADIQQPEGALAMQIHSLSRKEVFYAIFSSFFAFHLIWQLSKSCKIRSRESSILACLSVKLRKTKTLRARPP